MYGKGILKNVKSLLIWSNTVLQEVLVQKIYLEPIKY